MPIHTRCACGQSLVADDAFAGKRAACPRCGRITTIAPPQPTAAAPVTAAAQPQPEAWRSVDATPPADAIRARSQGTPAQPGAAKESSAVPPPHAPAPPKASPRGQAASPEEAIEIREYLDPPDAAASPDGTPALARVFEALLDPQSIHWMLVLGGGTLVFGLVVWLTSLGIFKDPWTLGVALIAGSLAIVGLGWAVTLRTHFRVAGHALTFLGCVVAPLNLWYLHAQGLVTLEGPLWIGGLMCCLLYIATVIVLRQGLFLYAVEAGVTLTVLLFLGSLHRIGDATYLSLALMVLAMLSIHAERAFDPSAAMFDRKRFGMPLFWSGHVQLGAALAILLGSQAAAWLFSPTIQFLGIAWPGNLLTQHTLLAAALYLAAAYAYVYSDVVVRRVGAYLVLAATCLLAAEITLVGPYLQGEGLIAVFALTALALAVVHTQFFSAQPVLARLAPVLTCGLSVLPLVIGMQLHYRATSAIAEYLGGSYATGWPFVAAMLVAAVCSRIAAWCYEEPSPSWARGQFFASGAAVILAAAGLLRALGLVAWHQQSPWLMLIPLAYLVGSWAWKARFPGAPLYWVAQTAAAVILVHTFGAAAGDVRSIYHTVQGTTINLLLGVVFLEAAIFYGLAWYLRGRALNAYLATAAACAALWQLMVYASVPHPYYTMIYAGLGLALLAGARMMGLEQVDVYGVAGQRGRATRGRGLAMFQVANTLIIVAALAALMKGVALLALQRVAWLDMGALLLTAGVTLLATAVAPGPWRRAYAATTVALAALAFLELSLQLDLPLWRKTEIFCVAAGAILVASSYVGLFREGDLAASELVTLGFWLGSLLVVAPLVSVVGYHRFGTNAISHWDEIALIALALTLLVSGIGGRVKATTLLGGAGLAAYLLMVVIVLGWRAQLAAGVYLASGGGLVFLLGLVLSVYRQQVLEIPEKISKREGIFQFITWR